MTRKSFIISLIILLATIAGVTLIGRRGEPVVVQTNLENIPMEIQGYKATEDTFPDSVYEVLNADRHVYRHYREDAGKEIDLYIGYYGTAKGGRTWHMPKGCLPAGGWTILKTQRVSVSSNFHPKGVDLNYILARKGETYVCLYHWYQSAGNKVLSTGFQQNVERFKGRILSNRNDGAFVQISVLTSEKEIEKANMAGKAFAERLLDLIPNYWPVEE